MKDCNIENLYEHLKNDGAFDCEHSRQAVKQYFKGQVDSITSITKNIENLLDLIHEAQSKFIEIIKHAESFKDAENPICEHEVH